MDSIGFWSTFQPKKLGWRSPYIGSEAVILPQTGPGAGSGHKQPFADLVTRAEISNKPYRRRHRGEPSKSRKPLRQSRWSIGELLILV